MKGAVPMLYVIMRLPDRRFVAPPSSHSSHVLNLQDAVFFQDLAEAMSTCCENEIAVPLKYLVVLR